MLRAAATVGEQASKAIMLSETQLARDHDALDVTSNPMAIPGATRLNSSITRQARVRFPPLPPIAVG